MIIVKNKVPVREVDGVEKSYIDGIYIDVESEGTWDDRVVIRVPGGQKIVVVAHDMLAAIHNATNVSR